MRHPLCGAFTHSLTGLEIQTRCPFQNLKREELSRIASVKFKKALPGCTRAASSRVLAFCVMAACLVFTLAVTAANLRLTYVTDSHGARQVVLTSESDPARVMSLSGIEARRETKSITLPLPAVWHP